MKDKLIELETKLENAIHTLGCRETDIHNYLMDRWVEAGLPTSSPDGVMGWKGGPGTKGIAGSPDTRTAEEVYQDILNTIETMSKIFNGNVSMIENLRNVEAK